MQIHQLQRNTKRARSNQIGRGGKRGKTSGKGMKGQKSRSGHRMRPEIRDIIKKIPKLRGRGKNIFTSIQKKPVVLNISALEKAYLAGEIVSPKTLAEKGLISARKDQGLKVKILGEGSLTKKLVIEGCLVSATAKNSVEGVGGEVR